MSLLSSTTMSFAAASKPAFDPPPKPRLRSSATTRTRGNRVCSRSTLSSVDPLSTTMISFAGLPATAASTDGRYFSSRSRPFQFGITTLADRPAGGTSALSRRRGRNRSAIASASTLPATRKAERISSGSASTTRVIAAMSRFRQHRPQTQPAPKSDPARRLHQAELFFQSRRLAL